MTKLVCSLALGVMLAACGGTAPPASAPPASPSAAPATSAAAASAPAKPAASAPAAASLAASGAASAAAKPASANKFTVPYTAYSGAFTPLWVAGEEGFFAKQGFDVSVQYMDANLAATALITGEIPFSSTPAIVSTILSGGDAVILAKLVSVPNFSLYASKDIQRVEDLKGKVLADTQRGTAPDNAVRDLLAKHGLKESDLQFAYFPNPTAALTSMVAGQAVAGILPAPVTVQARTQGFHEVTTTLKENVPGLAAAVSTKKARLKSDPANIRAYLMAIKDATAFAKANPARTKVIIGKYAKTDVPAEQEETYTAYEPTWNLSPVQTDDLAAIFRYSSDPKAASADPKTFFDNSFVESLP